MALFQELDNYLDTKESVESGVNEEDNNKEGRIEKRISGNLVLQVVLMVHTNASGMIDRSFQVV